jgi:hypothetical protein
MLRGPDGLSVYLASVGAFDTPLIGSPAGQSC